MCFNSLLLLPGRSVSEVWKELVESQDEKRKSRVLQKRAGRSSSSSAAAVPQPWPVTCWRYNHKVNNPQGLLALVKHLTLTLAEHPPHCTRSRLAGLRIMPVNGGAAGESEQHKGRRKPKCGFVYDGWDLPLGGVGGGDFRAAKPARGVTVWTKKGHPLTDVTDPGREHQSSTALVLSKSPIAEASDLSDG